MPVVEPYNISDPFSTAGKINLNYQIAPFTYITRKTSLYAVLKPVMMAALNPLTRDASFTQFCYFYKGSCNFSLPTRYGIDANTTLSQFDTRFNASPVGIYSPQNPNFFVSASQICDIPLIPLGVNGMPQYKASNASMQTYWGTPAPKDIAPPFPASWPGGYNIMTGDNSLERPYSYIYPRVTTQSNTFTVHVRAQSLKKIASDPNQAEWNEDTDLVTGEYRGSYTIERYFDPNTTTITDARGHPVSLSAITASSIEGNNPPAIRGAKWRIVAAKQWGQ